MENYKEFIQAHKVAVDYKEKDNKSVTVKMVSVENAEKACRLAQKELATKLLKEEFLSSLFIELEQIRDEKI
jgi:hypothetical protein